MMSDSTPFDLEAAKRGEPVQTRENMPLRFEQHLPHATPSQQLIFTDPDGKIITRYVDGRLHCSGPSPYDIVMTPKPRTVLFERWAGIIEGGGYLFVRELDAERGVGLNCLYIAHLRFWSDGTVEQVQDVPDKFAAQGETK